MRVLVANNHLVNTGGTENFTLTLISELKKRGYDVHYFTFEKGIISGIIEKELKVKFMEYEYYDLILASHNTCVDFLKGKGFVIQTCHGVDHILEKPSIYANYHVAISEEVQEYLSFLGIPSLVIWNGIDCEIFRPKTHINTKVKTILSLSHSENFNIKLNELCKQIDVNLITRNKYNDNKLDIPEMINSADLVFGIGRSAYEAMACGRPVIIYDEREYNGDIGDGYVNTNFFNIVKNNCSGRFYRKVFKPVDLRNEINKFNFSDTFYLREIALNYLNVVKTTDRYIHIYNQHNLLEIKKLQKKLLLKYFYNNNQQDDLSYFSSKVRFKTLIAIIFIKIKQKLIK
jgi:glycosyltransferase involved in cell wall biosynthesis